MEQTVHKENITQQIYKARKKVKVKRYKSKKSMLYLKNTCIHIYMKIIHHTRFPLYLPSGL